MTKSQKKIILKFFLAYIMIILFIISGDWVLSRWDKLKWPMFFIIQFIMFFKKDDVILSPKERSERLNRTVKKHPWIVIYLMCCVFIISIGLDFVMLMNIRLYNIIGPGELMGILLLFGAPFIVASIKDAYIKAAEIEDN